MAVYHVRYDSMTQATAVFSPVETGIDSTTLGAVKVPSGITRISKITAIVGLDAQGAAPVVTGANFVVRLGGNALHEGEQEIVVYKTQYESGGGTVTDTDFWSNAPFELYTNIPVKAGNDIKISAAYVGTDPGTPEISVELELS